MDTFEVRPDAYVVEITRVVIPAFSTLGYGVGTDEQGKLVTVIGDHRPMRDIGRAIAELGEPVTVVAASHLVIDGEIIEAIS